jgi:hypothetical protein
MREKFYEWSCDGCGDCETLGIGDVALEKAELKQCGWKFKSKDRAYCRDCVAKGKHKVGGSIF